MGIGNVFTGVLLLTVCLSLVNLATVPISSTENSISTVSDSDITDSSSSSSPGILETTGSESSGSETTGSESSGSETTGSESSGSETTGSETAGSETTGSESSVSSTSTNEHIKLDMDCHKTDTDVDDDDEADDDDEDEVEDEDGDMKVQHPEKPVISLEFFTPPPRGHILDKRSVTDDDSRGKSQHKTTSDLSSVSTSTEPAGSPSSQKSSTRSSLSQATGAYTQIFLPSRVDATKVYGLDLPRDICKIGDDQKPLDLSSILAVREVDPIYFKVSEYVCQLFGFSHITPVESDCSKDKDHDLFHGHFVYDNLTAVCDCGHLMNGSPWMTMVHITGSSLHVKIHNHGKGRYMYFYDPSTYGTFNEVDAEFGKPHQMEKFLDSFHKHLRTHFDEGFRRMANEIMSIISSAWH